MRSGAYPTPLTFPFVIGRDAVGTVAAVGAGVSGFTEGDPVWCNSLGHGGRQGPSATYTAVAAERLYHLPDGVDPVAAAAVLHTGATAHLGLSREARLRIGEIIVVGGAAGGVGGAVLQIAASAGARVIAVARSDQASWCRANGAQEVLDYQAPDLAGHLRRAAPDGIDVYWDMPAHGHDRSPIGRDPIWHQPQCRHLMPTPLVGVVRAANGGTGRRVAARRRAGARSNGLTCFSLLRSRQA
ncbi:zinc-binding dehydrogenase [Planotetraspora thailandica]|uniref:zinc-binding dehydrogenase n=1 Tax=Planotetraspora thailandica TaxID=487172 RepID=UPI001EF31A46|nr:zinc-binding dehydrogenase [Planotetraspora thailandica]